MTDAGGPVAAAPGRPVPNLPPAADLRVAFVLGAASGGTASHVSALAAGCQGAGLTVAAFGPEETRHLFGAGIAWKRAQIGSRPRPVGDTAAVLRLRSGLRAMRPDVVHAHGVRAGAFAALALLGMQVPLVVSVHNAPPEGRTQALIYSLLERICASRADLVLCASADLLARMRRVVAAGPSAADISAADISAAGPSAAGPSAADISAAGHGAAGLSAADPQSADTGAAGPGAAGPHAADSSAADPQSANTQSADTSATSSRPPSSSASTSHPARSSAARFSAATSSAARFSAARFSAARFSAARSRATQVELFDVPAPPADPPAPAAIEAAIADLAAHGRPVVLAVGRLAAQKGLDVLVDAAARWRDREPRPLTVIAGAGPLAAELMAQAARAGADVRLLGARQDVPALLAIADVVVAPSRWEARPLVIQEAMRAGCAIVASRVGGIPDLVGPEGAALIPPDDPAALAAAVTAVLDDPGLAARLRRAARGHAGTFPSQKDAVQAAVTIYTRLATLP